MTRITGHDKDTLIQEEEVEVMAICLVEGNPDGPMGAVGTAEWGDEVATAVTWILNELDLFGILWLNL